jgi:hypothetical protein
LPDVEESPRLVAFVGMHLIADEKESREIRLVLKFFVIAYYLTIFGSLRTCPVAHSL